jgi:copper(I)-binding protein
MRLLLGMTFAALALHACNSPPADPRVSVQDAIVTLPAIPGRPGAAYFTLRTNRSPTTLVSVTSPLVQRIELHQNKAGGGMAKITSPEDLSFSGNGRLEFEPGGKHAMLFGINPSVKPGATIPLTFTVDPAPAVTVDAQVRGPGDAHAGH